jgi:hypothetical protein
MRLFLILFIFLATVTGYAQNAVENIDMRLIPQKKVRVLIRHQFTENHLLYFHELLSTYQKGQDS